MCSSKMMDSPVVSDDLESVVEGEYREPWSSLSNIVMQERTLPASSSPKISLTSLPVCSSNTSEISLHITSLHANLIG